MNIILKKKCLGVRYWSKGENNYHLRRNAVLFHVSLSKMKTQKSGIYGRILSTTGFYCKSYVISFPPDVDEFCNYGSLSHNQVMFYGTSEGIWHTDQDVVSLTLSSLKGKLFKVSLT